MRKNTNSPGEKIFKDIQRASHTYYSPDEKIGIVLEGPRSQERIRICVVGNVYPK